MNINDITIRLENKEDYAEVESLVREAFWNVYRPGCLEHYVIHVLRDDPAFIKELDFVMETGGKIIGQNMFMKTVIESEAGGIVPALTMGPICITPALKRRGLAKSCWIIRLNAQKNSASERSSLKEISPFTVKAVSIMPEISA